jgi:integrase
MDHLAAIFDTKVDRSGEHHLWTGAKTQRQAGQIRIDGHLRTATQVAWELEHGPIPDGHVVVSCSSEKLCVKADHLSLKQRRTTNGASTQRRSKRGGGSITKVGTDRWKITVDAGRDQTGKRRRVTRTISGTKVDANRALAALNVEVQTGEKKPSPTGGTLTVDELINWYLPFAQEVRGLQHSTVVGYRDPYDKWLSADLGHLKADRLTPAQLDRAFGKMRQAGLSHSRMNNARSALAGAYKWGKRHDKVSSNPVKSFELPTTKTPPKPSKVPELEDLLTILAGADEHTPEIAPVLKLASTTGMRRGELSGLCRDRLNLDSGELIVDQAVNDAGGEVVIKSTKTNSSRLVALDEHTVAMLQAHLKRMDERARQVETTIADDAFVFSLDPACRKPMRPDFMSRRMRQLRNMLGIDPADFDVTILALRRWTSSELLDAGFNPSTVSDRQGHTIQVMLKHYSKRRRSADLAAAEHLGSRLLGSSQTVRSTHSHQNELLD